MNRAAIYRRIHNLYASREHEATMRRQAAWENLLNAHPEFARLDKDLQTARWKLLEAWTRPDMSAEDKSKLEENLARLEFEYSAAEATLYPEMQKEEHFYSCPVCKDKGYLEEKRPCPSCFGKTMTSILETIPHRLLPEKSAKFSATGEDPEVFSNQTVTLAGKEIRCRDLMQRYFTYVRDFCAEFESRDEDFYFSGKTGTGKSYLASCMVWDLLDRGKLAIMLSEFTFSEMVSNLRTLQRAFSPRPEDMNRAEEQYALLLEADFLVLDDFGSGMVGVENPLAEIQKLLHERKVRGNRTVFTSNIPIQDLGRAYDQRLLSRILERFTIWQFPGEDLRVVMRQQRRK